MQCDYQYDFIYKEHTDVRIIVKVPMAIGISHGAPDNYRDRLWHTFSTENKYVASQGATTNLMDYSNNATSTDLYKYQWDYIHNPESVLFRGDDEEGEIREKDNIRWIGDWLEGYASDNLEKIVEDKLTLFNDVAKNYDSYYNESKSKDVDVSDGWSVRSSSHKMSIGKSLFEKISKLEAPKFTLHEKGVYFEEYKLEDVDYRLAVYSYSSSVQLNVEDIKIMSYSDLADNKNIKAGYTNLEGGYGLIVFYQNSAPIMVLQIIDKTPEKAVEKWLNYLSLVLPSDEQKRKDGENASGFEIHPIDKLIEIWESFFKSDKFIALEQADELTPAEIKEYRDYIKTLPEKEQGDWYLELQKKVPYHNQRDNESLARDTDIENNSWLKDGDTAGDIMCNLTSEAMCLEMLGVEFPCKDCDSDCDKYSQFEDYLECLRLGNEYGDRKEYLTRNSLSLLFGINCDIEESIYSNNKIVLESRLKNALKEGKSILISMSFGHIVRLQAITNEGLIVDDPYGKVCDFSQSGCTAKYKCNGTDSRNGNNLGKDNLWTWSDLQTNNITIKYAEIYSIND